jgi:hypothetical protein
MKRVAAYIRVSTDKQSTDSQLVAIKNAIQRSGDVLVQVYEPSFNQVSLFVSHTLKSNNQSNHSGRMLPSRMILPIRSN